ncbi:MAG: glycoside hydrolase family 2 TIM barrel-domain containing protein [Woeseiaceae bacterium]|nr:glycoside hydrolase family 2 TIM barrel-domain containing protein [Woeseiaceae bacterium]
MRKLLWALLVAGPSLLGGNVMAEAIPVELKETEKGWQLLRGGEPYFIKGAGGSGSLEQLAAAGGNSVRTWSTDGVGEILDAAHALGLTVTVGIWLGHERHGFDYSDENQILEQKERVRKAVLSHKDHPAVLLWGIGNEMEGFEDGDNPAIWNAVNDIAAMVKELDPHHPTMTVTTFVHGDRVEYVHRQSPAIDIHGVNAYGGAQVVAQWLRDRNASKPFVLTEFGPVGPWETETTEWGAPYEQTSTDKAEFYRQSYENGILAEPGFALGSYAFLWGSKMEATETWFGMFLEDGAKTAAVDAMTELWSGTPSEDLAPLVEPLAVEGTAQVDPGAEITVKSVVTDPEGSILRARWSLRPESADYSTGGDFRPNLPEIDGVVLESSIDGARVRMPEEPGAYRLFLYAYDEAGNAATANVPLLVKGSARTRFPVSVYEDSFGGMPWAPSGWMGNIESLTLDGEYADVAPYEGSAAIRMRYEGTFGWVAVAWQDPPNNWGDISGGYDLTGATALELWARGEYGGEKVSFGVGIIRQDKAHPDSAIRKTDDIRLTPEWQRYTVSLKDVDLSSIKTGFVVSLTGRRTPVTIYLDRIRFVR